MALGIKTESIFKKYDIPLFGLHDPNWEDNTWICEHLRHLADTIERENIKIFEVNLKIDMNYKIPHIEIATLKK